MYTVAKGPTVILQKTRRAGLAKSLDSNTPSDTGSREREQREQRVGAASQDRDRQDSGEYRNNREQTSRIIFQPVKMRNNQRRRVQAESLSPEHRELVTFVTEGWVRVKREMDQGEGKVAVYQDSSNPRLEQFEPFDLDAWWGRKLYQNLTSGI